MPTPTPHQNHLTRYTALPSHLEALLANTPDNTLNTPPAPGEWSPRQIIHHLGDSELMDAARLRLIAAEDNPKITPYDELRFAARLSPDRPIAPSLAAVRAARESGADILARLNNHDFQRPGRHPEHAAYTLAIWLEKAVEHGESHLAQLRAALDNA